MEDKVFPDLLRYGGLLGRAELLLIAARGDCQGNNIGKGHGNAVQIDISTGDNLRIVGYKGVYIGHYEPEGEEEAHGRALSADGGEGLVLLTRGGGGHSYAVGGGEIGVSPRIDLGISAYIKEILHKDHACGGGELQRAANGFGDNRHPAQRSYVYIVCGLYEGIGGEGNF